MSSEVTLENDMSRQPFLTEVFPGLVVDLYYHDDNPAKESRHEYLFESGFWEMVATVTPDHLSIMPETNRALFVVPTREIEVTAPRYDALFLLKPGDRILELTHCCGLAHSESGPVPSDVLFVYAGPRLKNADRYFVAIIHNRDGLEVYENMQMQ